MNKDNGTLDNCPRCDGKGQTEHKECPRCKGTGKV